MTVDAIPTFHARTPCEPFADPSGRVEHINTVVVSSPRRTAHEPGKRGGMNRAHKEHN